MQGTGEWWVSEPSEWGWGWAETRGKWNERRLGWKRSRWCARRQLNACEVRVRGLSVERRPSDVEMIRWWVQLKRLEMLIWFVTRDRRGALLRKSRRSLCLWIIINYIHRNYWLWESKKGKILLAAGCPADDFIANKSAKADLSWEKNNVSTEKKMYRL